MVQFDGIRKSGTIQKLLKALALQIGSEVSFNELANTIGDISSATLKILKTTRKSIRNISATRTFSEYAK